MKVSGPALVGVLWMAVVLGLSSPSVAVESGNGEYWQTNTLTWYINDDYSIKATEEFKLGRDRGSPHTHNIDLGLVYSGFADWLEISGNVKKEYTRDWTGQFRQENRVHFNLTVKQQLLGCGFSNRSRIEYRDFQEQKDQYRFRNKTTVKFPWKLTALGLKPYMAEEIFVKLGEDNVNKNRLSGGLSLPVCENLDAAVYYMWERGKISGGWRDTNVIGTEFKFAF